MPVAPSDAPFASGRFDEVSLLVVGAGPVGRWIAGVLDAGDTAFCDTDRATARGAAERVGGRVVDVDSAERFDLVGVAVPISAVEDAIATHASRAHEGLFDVTGTMGEPVAAMATHAPAIERVSLHPLFAPERAPGRVAMVTGSEPSDSGDVGGERATVDGTDDGDGNREGTGNEDGVDDADDAGPVAAGLERALRAAGNEPFATSPTEHDRAMATVQACAHAAVLAYALAAEPVDERFHTPVSDALAEVALRVTAGSARTYAEIQAAFEGSDTVAAAAERIAAADDEEFRRLYREARSKTDAEPSDAAPSDGETG